MDLANIAALVTIFAAILCATGSPFVNTEVYALEGCGNGRANCPARPLIKERKPPEVGGNVKNCTRGGVGESSDVASEPEVEYIRKQ